MVLQKGNFTRDKVVFGCSIKLIMYYISTFILNVIDCFFGTIFYSFMAQRRTTRIHKCSLNILTPVFCEFIQILQIKLLIKVLPFLFLACLSFLLNIVLLYFIFEFVYHVSLNNDCVAALKFFFLKMCLLHFYSVCLCVSLDTFLLLLCTKHKHTRYLFHPCNKEVKK